MTKEEKIKEAWGLAYDEVKHLLTDNRYIWSVDLAHIRLSNYNLDLNYNDIGARPKSLQGIENNNGWKSIKEDLPKQIGYYIMYDGKNTVLIELNDTTDMITLREQFIKDGFTHYQPIEKPKPPIY